MMILLLCLLAFILSLAIDFFYAQWLLALNDQRALASMLHSSICSLLGSLSCLILMDCWLTILPAALGHALGTGLALTLDYRVRELEQKMQELEHANDDGPDFSEFGEVQ